MSQTHDLPTDWIELYLHYARHQVSPTIYHRWSAIAVLGAAMERRVHMVRKYAHIRIYPGQIMVVLVGKSALAKKTTAASMAVQFLDDLPAEYFLKLPKKTSPQQLLEDLQRCDGESKEWLRYSSGPFKGTRLNSAGFINAGELSVFFSSDAFNETMAATINDLNDAPNGIYPVRFRSWKAELWNPVVGLLGCITPKGIASELPKTARTAGFFGRILWVYGHGPDHGDPLTGTIEDEPELVARLKRGIRKISLHYGEIVYSNDARKWFEDWSRNVYDPQVKRIEQGTVNDTTGYLGRKDGHLLRVAMACLASRTVDRYRDEHHRDHYELRIEDLTRALGYLEEMEEGFAYAMMEVGVGPHLEENERVLQFIAKEGKRNTQGWVPKASIIRFSNRMGMRKFHMDDCIDRLRFAGDIETNGDLNKICYRRVWSKGDLVRLAMEEQSPD